MLSKEKIANEFGEVIGAYWYHPSMNAFTLRLYGVNRNGYTEQGDRQLVPLIRLSMVGRDLMSLSFFRANTFGCITSNI